MIMKSNHQRNTTMPTKPCPSCLPDHVPHAYKTIRPFILLSVEGTLLHEMLRIQNEKDFILIKKDKTHILLVVGVLFISFYLC